jgi:hypothetical protein
MKRSEQPAQPMPAAKPFRLQSAGLYGEVVFLPPNRGVVAPVREPKTFA